MIKAVMEYSNPKNEIYVNTNNCNLNRSRKTMVASDDMIADINTNQKFPSIVKELFIKCRKLNSSQNLIFLAQKIKLYTLPNNENL